MNHFEKLLMVIVPLSGLAMLFYFFSFYTSNLENQTFQDSQRLQGHPFKQATVQKSITQQSIAQQYQNPYKPKVVRQVTPKKAYIKWQSDKTVTQMSESLKNRKYEHTRQQASYAFSNESVSNQNSITAKQKIQRQKQQRVIKQNQKNIRDKKCSYYAQQKEEIRDRMRRKYTASQYNWLEKRRKHWAKLYADNCFSGYQYPR